MQNDILKSDEFSKIKPILKSFYESELQQGKINNGADCLTNEEIYKYTNHTLDESERDAVYEHISKCMPCYLEVEQWYKKKSLPDPEALSKMLETKTKDYINDDRGVKDFIKLYFAQFITLILTINTIQKRYIIATSAVFLLAIFFLLNINTQAPYINLIEQSFQMAQHQQLFFVNDYFKDSFIESQSFSEDYQHERQALKDGVKFGKQSISQTIGKPLESKDIAVIQKDTWSKTPQSIYFWLGNWFVVLKNVCASGEEINTDFLSIQLKTIKAFQASFAESPPYDKKITQVLEQLEEFIHEAVKLPSQKRDLNFIVKLIDGFIKQLQ